MNNNEYTIKKHYDGCYRVRVEEQEVYFGQVFKQGREWYAEIRFVETGDMVQYAGIWNTRRDAVEECVFFMRQWLLDS